MAPLAIKRFPLPWLSTWTGRRNCWACGWLKRNEPSSGSASSTNSRHRRRLWSEQYPAISPGWARNWDRLKPFFGYSLAIRNAVYTTNAIESLSCSLNVQITLVLNPRERRPAFTAGFRIVVKSVADVMRQECQPLILKSAGDNQVFQRQSHPVFLTSAAIVCFSFSNSSFFLIDSIFS